MKALGASSYGKGNSNGSGSSSNELKVRRSSLLDKDQKMFTQPGRRMIPTARSKSLAADCSTGIPNSYPAVA